MFSSHSQSLAPLKSELFGRDQSWVNETANRAKNVIYTNTSKRDILVCYVNNYATTIKVDGLKVCDSVYASSRAPITFIVPAGSTYVAECTTQGSPWYWSEFK